MSSKKARGKHPLANSTQNRKMYTYREFVRKYGNDDELLHMIWEWHCEGMQVCPKCKKQTTYHRLTKRTQYACSSCSHQIAPRKNTPFYRSHVSLSLWFYALYLFSVKMNELRVVELERILGVEYHTAYRMLSKITELSRTAHLTKLNR